MPTPTVWLPEVDSSTRDVFAGNQPEPRTIGLANGMFLVAWVEDGDDVIEDADGTGIIGTIHNAEGQREVFNNFQLNTSFFDGNEQDFDIAPTNDGGFILVYTQEDIQSLATKIIWEYHDHNGDINLSRTIDSANIIGTSVTNPQVSVDLTNNQSVVTYTDYLGGIQTLTLRQFLAQVKLVQRLLPRRIIVTMSKKGMLPSFPMAT